MGQAHPPSPYLSFVFLLFRGRNWVLSFLLSGGIWGKRRTGTPYYDCVSWSGVGKG